MDDVKTLKLDIGGMHCGNCEIWIERKLKDMPGVRWVRASYPRDCVTLEYSGTLDRGGLNRTIAEAGYTVTGWHEQADAPAGSRGLIRHYAESAAVFLLLTGGVLLLQQLDLLPRGFGISDNISYGAAFVIGLLASVSSCLAVTGGLFVALAATYNEANAGATPLQKLAPHLWFNAGRIVSYALLGGAIGALGSALMLSPEVNGILTIAASSLMILLGLQMLKLLPPVGRFLPRLPNALSHRIHDLASRRMKGGAFLLGAATFFLPCGFTQALQLYVLSKGSFTVGALTMLAFAFGTLPALLSLSALSSFAQGAFQRHFLKIAGAAVVVLGFLNIQYGLVLTGAPAGNALVTASQNANVRMISTSEGPTQIAEMKVVGLEYHPNRFVVQQGVPVVWRIDAREAEGCGRVLIARKLRITRLLSVSQSTIIAFTPQELGEFEFNCGMGMMTPGSMFTVIPSRSG